MRRRTLVTLLALTAAVALVATLPQTPPGRAWLLSRVRAALERSGVQLSYARSGGDPWRGVQLQGAAVSAPGLKLTARRVDVRYFLPSLLTGELPLTVTLEGVRGSVDVDKLAAMRPARGSFPVVPVLQQLSVGDASVRVQQVPYTIPSGSVSDIRVRQHGAALEVQARLRTSDGSAAASGVLDLTGPRFDGRVTRADVTLARHWFPGATGGTFSGPLHIGPDGIRGDFTLQNGSLDAIGLKPHGIAGQVRLRYPLVTARLHGTALGGPVQASGTVNIAARHWQAQLSGTPELLPSADWLAQGALSQMGSLPLSGTARATLSASGWADVRLKGSASGSGTLAGLPLAGLQSDFTYDTRRGVTVRATGRIAGGSAALTAAPAPAGTSIEAQADQMEPLPGHSVDARLELLVGPRGATGQLHATDRAVVLTRHLQVGLDAGLNGDGWQGVIRGSDGRGAKLEGAAALAGGRLTGEVRVHGLSVPWLSRPVDASLRADGTLAQLPLALTLTAGGPLRAALGPETLGGDLRGRLTATLVGTRLQQVEGALGPLSVSGSLTLAPLGGGLEASLAPSPLLGPVHGRVAAERGRVELAPGGLRTSATLHLSRFEAGPVAVGLDTLSVEAGTAGGFHAHLADGQGRLALDVAGGKLDATFAALPLGLGSVDVTLNGSLRSPLGPTTGAVLSGLDPALTATTGPATLAVSRSGGHVRLAVSAPAGGRLGPVTLARAVHLAGSLEPSGQGATLTGSLGATPLSASLRWDAPGPRAGLALGAAPRALHAELGPGGWSVRGELAFGDVAAALGVPAAGEVRADLSGGAGGYAGTATVRTTAPVPAALALKGTGATLGVELTGSVAGRALAAAGTLLPSPAIAAKLGPFGPIAVDGNGIRGSGTTPPSRLGPALTLGAMPWTLQGTLRPLSVTLELGSGHARYRAGALAAALDLPLDYGGRALELGLATGGPGPVDAAVGAPRVRLAAGAASLPVTGTLADASGTTLLALSGTAAALRLHGTLPASLATAPLPAPLRAAGSLELNGEAHLTGRPSYQLDAVWKIGKQSIRGRLTGRGASFTAAAEGPGLSLQAAPGRASLDASDAAVGPLLAGVASDLRLDGTLSFRAGSWQGALTARATAPAALKAELIGRGTSLGLQLAGDVGAVSGAVSGDLLPRPRLHADVSADAGAARLQVSSVGGWRDLRVEGVLSTRAVDRGPWLAVPARRAAVAWTPASGAVSARGDGIELGGTLGSVHGRLTLPFDALGAKESLRATVSGGLLSPSLEAAIEGPALRGNLSASGRRGVAASADVSAAALRPFLGPGRAWLASDVALQGRLSPDGSWDATGSTAVGTSRARLPVKAHLTGRGGTYDGGVALFGPRPPTAAAAPLATASVRGTGTSLAASLDLASVDYRALGKLLGVPLQLTASGRVELTARPPALSVDVRASGKAAGRDVSLSGQAGGGRGVSLDASFGGVRAQLSGAAGAPLAVEVASPDHRVALRGTAELGGRSRISLVGEAHGAPLKASAQADLPAGTGQLELSLGRASLSAALAHASTPEPGGSTVAVTAQAPPGSLAPVGVRVSGSLAARAGISGGAVDLESLSLAAASGPTRLRLALAGPVYPVAQLSGTLKAPTWNAEAAVALRGPLDGLEARARLGRLGVTAQARGTRLERIDVDGSAQLRASGRPVDLSAQAFAWDAGSGFSGHARLTTPGSGLGVPGEVSADLTGAGDLSVAASAGPSGRPWATAEATLARRPWLQPELHGTVTLAVPIGRLASLPSRAPLELTGSPTLGGTWSHPSLAGQVRLSGALSGQGTLQVSPAAGALELSGQHLDVRARYDAGAWTGTASLVGAPLGGLDPRLKGVHASLKADVGGGGRAGLHADVSSVDVTAPGVALTGTATLGKGVRAALQVRADLSAMGLPGPALAGVVHGPLVLAAPSLADVRSGTLIAVLDVANVGVSGMGGAVDGTLQLGGTPADPVLSAQLQGTGGVTGQARLDAAPGQGRFDLHSTLAYRSIATDVTLTLDGGRVEASGTASAGHAGVRLATGPQGGLTLTGSDGLAGWHATVDPSLRHASLQGPLSSLSRSVRGELDVGIGGSPWLKGSVAAASVTGVRLGDLELTSAGPGTPVSLEGHAVRASLRPATLAWDLAVSGLALPGGVRLSGSASGQGRTGDASLKLAGELVGAPLNVNVKARDDGGLRLSAHGQALGGDLSLTAQRQRGGPWGGAVALEGAGVGGVEADVKGTIAGPSNDPGIDAQLSFQGAAAGSATLRASLGRASVEGTVSSPALGRPLTVTGALAPALDLTVSATGAGASQGPGGSVRLFEGGGALRATGALSVAAGPALVTVSGTGRSGPVALGLRLRRLPEVAFSGRLPAAPPLAAFRKAVSNGLDLRGTGRTEGRIALQLAPALRAELDGVRFPVAGVTVSASGSIGLAASRLSGDVTLPRSLPVERLGGASLPYQAAYHGGDLAVRSSGTLGTVDVNVSSRTGTGRVSADLRTPGAGPGSASVELTFDPHTGPSGSLRVQAVHVARAGLPALTLGADLHVGSGTVSGSIDVGAPKGGGIEVTGSWGLGGWLPPALAPGAPAGGRAEARVDTLDLASLPTVQRLAPHVRGKLSGVVRLRDHTVVGQLVAPDLAVADTRLPLSAQLSGPLDGLDVRVKLAQTVLTGTLLPGEARGLVELKRFPAQVLAEAETGSTDIKAEVDGLLRFDVPFAHPASSYLRMATEALRLERAGVVTTGNVAWVYNDRAFTIEHAAFQGRGRWQAQGTVNAHSLDLKLNADNADFTPLLGLVPLFARYGVAANGSFSLVAKGTPARPDVTLSATGLEARVAGTHYRVDRAVADLKGSALTASARVVGVAPLGGALDVHGGAQLTLAPLALRNADFRFTGSAQIPVIGAVTKISGGITQPPGRPPQLAVAGRLGGAFSLRGSLAPFDVTLRGKGLDLVARPLFVTSSSMDADVRLRATARGLAVGGELDASEIRMDLGSPGAPQPSGPTPTAAPPGPAGPSPPPKGYEAALHAVIFDQLHLKAPQRVLLDASFGNAEASLDLTLTGTAASPQLSGTAKALRGSLRFGGRDFTIDQAVASFQPSRGAYPALSVQAHTVFDKRRVLSGTSGVSFATPRDSNTFTVSLDFTGQVQPAAQGPLPVTFDIKPTLSTDATIQTSTGGATSAARPLSDQELLSLITLGRLEVQPQLAGQSGIGTAVAHSAIDTAVDVLVVSELQNALSKALGIDVVEIRTTPLSSLLDNSGQPFGVSLRLGGYLTPQLFASYRLGNFNGVGQPYAFTNEVSLSYDLGPLNFDLSGQLSFPDATDPSTAIPQLGMGLRYALTNDLGLDAGIDLSNARQQAHFGVSLRW